MYRVALLLQSLLLTLFLLFSFDSLFGAHSWSHLELLETGAYFVATGIVIALVFYFTVISWKRKERALLGIIGLSLFFFLFKDFANRFIISAFIPSVYLEYAYFLILPILIPVFIIDMGRKSELPVEYLKENKLKLLPFAFTGILISSVIFWYLTIYTNTL